MEECGPCPVFAGYTLAFALQLRKKHGKTSVRVAEECQLAPSTPRITTEEIALQRQGTAFSLVSEGFGFLKVSASWVPKHLTEDHKYNRPHICSSLFERYNREGDNLLNHIITGDEKWIH